MERRGASAVIAEGTESGGHIGETTTMCHVPQEVDAVSIPVIAAGGNADSAIKLILANNMEELMKIQVEAIKNIKIDKVTVWDGGSNGENGKTATADFISGIMKAIPPMGEMFNQAGMELPKFLGEKIDTPKTLDS